MMIPGRKYTSGEYRYGFNGKENDYDISAGAQDYGMRINDSRLGRFLSVDPLTKGYPELTPYQFASNRTIDGIDQDGLEVIQYTLAKQGVYGPTVAKILNGSEKGVKASLKNTWNFFAGDAWKAQTWINAGKFIEQGALSMSAVPVAPTPMVDAKVDEFINDVVRGDAFSSFAYISEFGTNIATGIIADKGISKLSLLAKIRVRTNFATSWGVATEYVDFNKAVYTRTLKEGTELIQYRVKGLEGTVGNYYAKPGTSPESIGIPSSQVGETLRVKVKSDTKALLSTHKKNTTFYKDGTTHVSGGGQQIYSTELKNNIEIIK